MTEDNRPRDEATAPVGDATEEPLPTVTFDQYVEQRADAEDEVVEGDLDPDLAEPEGAATEPVAEAAPVTAAERGDYRTWAVQSWAPGVMEALDAVQNAFDLTNEEYAGSTTHFRALALPALLNAEVRLRELEGWDDSVVPADAADLHREARETVGALLVDVDRLRQELEDEDFADANDAAARAEARVRQAHGDLETLIERLRDAAA